VKETLQLFAVRTTKDADLVLHICERVLDRAEQTGLYRRVRRGGDQGNVTVVVRFAKKQLLLGPAPIVTLRSPTSEVEKANGSPAVCDLGWMDAREIEPPERHDVTRDFIALAFVLYCRPAGFSSE
jgi:hypothetical protein